MVPPAWTPREDEFLLALVSKQYEATSWTRLAQQMPGRGVHACRGRFIRLCSDMIDREGRTDDYSWMENADLAKRALLDRVNLAEVSTPTGTMDSSD